MAIAGPKNIFAQIIGPGGNPVDFPVRPTVNGAVLGPLPYTIPTLTASAPVQISAAGVTFNAVSYTQDGNGWADLGFIATATPSTAPTDGSLSSFTLSMPGRSTSFTDKYGVRANCGNAIDDGDNNIGNTVIRSVPSSTNVYIAFLANSTTSVHALHINLKYKLI